MPFKTFNYENSSIGEKAEILFVNYLIPIHQNLFLRNRISLIIGSLICMCWRFDECNAVQVSPLCVINRGDLIGNSEAG